MQESRVHAVGTLVGGRYHIERLLGEGGMGCVYRAHDRLLDEVVALKVLHADLLQSPAVVASFRREVKLARRITHRNVARVFDLGFDEAERPYFTMELLEGPTLFDVLERRGRLSAEEVISLSIQICEGLHAAHLQGVTHRDLKPENVMLCDGRAVVTDFGIAHAKNARDAHPQLTDGGMIVGTPEFMSPEQVRGDAIEARSDIFAVGAFMFYLLTGRFPFTGASHYEMARARLVDPPIDPRTFTPTSDEMAHTILRCLEREPRDRFESARALAEHLRGMPTRQRTATGGAGQRAATLAPIDEPQVALDVRADHTLALGFGELLARELRHHGIFVAHATARPGLRPVLEVELSRGEGRLRGYVGITGTRVNTSRFDHRIDVADAQAGSRARDVGRAVAGALGFFPRSDFGAVPRLEMVAALGRASTPGGLDGAIVMAEQLLRVGGGQPEAIALSAELLLRRAEIDFEIDADASEALALTRSIRASHAEAPALRGLARLALGQARDDHDGLRSTRALPSWGMLVGRLALRGGEPQVAQWALDRAASALSTDLGVAIDLALANAAAGDVQRGIERLLALPADRLAWWLAISRLGLWHAEPEALRGELGRLASSHFTGRDEALSIFAATVGAGAPDDALRRLDGLLGQSVQTQRRRVAIELAAVELCLARGRDDEAISRLRALVQRGASDAGWAMHCPLAARVRARPSGDDLLERFASPARELWVAAHAASLSAPATQRLQSATASNLSGAASASSLEFKP